MSKINLTQTQVRIPDSIKWTHEEGFPQDSIENAVLAGSLEGEGIYFTLVKWYPDYMSAPHYYATDRLCVVVSGVWWVNSGNDFDPDNNDFDPDNSVLTPVGSYVRRVAGAPHYDGVIASGAEPAVIAISGIAPVHVKSSLIPENRPGVESSAVGEVSDGHCKRRSSFVSY
jgi:hypothetical protein